MALRGAGRQMCQNSGFERHENIQNKSTLSWLVVMEAASCCSDVKLEADGRRGFSNSCQAWRGIFARMRQPS